ncbi:MAG: hypothetical protein K8R25_14960 [Methanosarcinales archaeon]|nr:hypothetical protein [Methanosarcinales archaeon]
MKEHLQPTHRMSGGLENPQDFRNHPDDNHASDYILFKLPFMTGMSPIAKVTLRSLALRAVVVDTKELRTVPHATAFSVLFIQEQIRMGGFKPAVGYDFFISNVLVVYLSLLCFKARRQRLRFRKNGASRLMLRFL